jgi:uncharacterized protein DUF4340
MLWRQVVLLYAVAVALGGWYLAIGGRQPEAPKTEERRPFLNLDARGLREVRVRRADSVMVSRLDAGAWVVVEPKGGFVPSDLIAAFTNALVAAQEIARVADPTDDAKQYGLDERASRIEIVPQTGDEIVVVLGQTNPTGTAVYARRDAAPEVILVGRNIRYYEDLIFEALSAREAPTTEQGAPVGG